MNEIPKNTNQIEKKKNFVFPERSFLGVEEVIEKIKKIESGEIQKIELSETEKEKILDFENNLGEQLEEIFDIKVIDMEIYPDFFLTDEGRNLFEEITGFSIVANSPEEVEGFFYENREKIAALDGKKQAKLKGQSKKFSQEKQAEEIRSTLDQEGNINIQGLENPKRFFILLSPEKALEKIHRMRKFKRHLVQDYSKENANESENYNKVQGKIVNLYRKRINEIIAEMFGYSVMIEKMSNKIGSIKLAEKEEGLLHQYPGMKKFVDMFSRYDKFVHGSGNTAENEKQIGRDLENLANLIEEQSLENEKNKRRNAAAKGIDFYKLAKTYDIPKETFAFYAEKFFQEYGQKSSEPADTFDPNRKGPASDDKWQYCARSTYNAFDVSLKQKVIKAPIRDRSIEDLVAILLGHEFTHFVQMLNQEKLPLRLFKKVCGDRRDMLVEGGGMMMQSKISEELFGYKFFPRVQYVRAMAERQKGGTYLDCAKVFYQSSIKLLQANEGFNELPKIKKEELMKKEIDTAVKSVKRLFASGDDYNSKVGFLTGSRATVYLEQYAAMEKLKEKGLDKYCLVRGLNLKAIASLMEMGFIDVSNIEIPKVDFIKKVWKEIKGKCLLE